MSEWINNNTNAQYDPRLGRKNTVIISMQPDEEVGHESRTIVPWHLWLLLAAIIFAMFLSDDTGYVYDYQHYKTYMEVNDGGDNEGN